MYEREIKGACRYQRKMRTAEVWPVYCWMTYLRKIRWMRAGWCTVGWVGGAQEFVLLANVLLEELEQAHRVDDLILQRCSSVLLSMANIASVGSNSRNSRIALMSSPVEKPLPGGVGQPHPILLAREAEAAEARNMGLAAQRIG
jgi:hypothetical protein